MDFAKSVQEVNGNLAIRLLLEASCINHDADPQHHKNHGNQIVKARQSQRIQVECHKKKSYETKSSQRVTDYGCGLGVNALQIVLGSCKALAALCAAELFRVIIGLATSTLHGLSVVPTGRNICELELEQNLDQVTNLNLVGFANRILEWDIEAAILGN